MGTRGLTVVLDGDKEVCVLYRQFDSYPEGHGKELAAFLEGFTITDGFTVRDKIGTSANGMGCLAAQLVKHFKTEIGGFYLYPSGTRDVGEEYVYTVYRRERELRVACMTGPVTFFGMASKEGANSPAFDGTVAEFKAWCSRNEEDDG